MPTVLVVDDSQTIREVVATVLHARDFKTLAAGDGRQALQVLREHEVDLVLLDFVMPVMNGYQFCRELRADSQWKNLPVVLMSAKGDKIRGQFVQQTGAVDAITKPFDPKALVAVIESALSKPKRESTSVPSSYSDDGGINIGELDAIEDEAERADAIRQAFTKSLARVIAQPLERERSALEGVLASSLTQKVVGDLGGILNLLDLQGTSAGALSGDLSFISIAEVMQMLELQRQTGALRIHAGDQQIVLFLSGGRIELAKSHNLPGSFRLGRFLVEDSVLSRESLQPLLEASSSQRLLGEELVERSKATEAQVRLALRRQTSELVYEAVRWKTGRFEFDSDESCPEATLAHLELAPGGLLMEGFRRVDEWQLIEGSFKFDDVLMCDEAMLRRFGESQELTPQEELVLSTVDGTRTVRQVVDDVDASTFDVCKALYQFLKARLIRQKTT